MYAAFLNNQLVSAISQIKVNEQDSRKITKAHYFCPHCQQEVRLVTKKQTAYFKHVPRISNLTNEKKEHALSKKLLKQALIDAKFPARTEVSLANGQLRADVLASSTLAFEVQCAPLNKSEFRHRHHLYQQIGIKDVWVVGRRHFLVHNLKKTQLIFFRENKLWGDYYLEIDPAQALLRLKYHVLLEPITSRVHYQSANFKLNSQGLATLWHFHPHFKIYQVNPLVQKDFLQVQLAQKTALGLKIGAELYDHHLASTDLPEWVFERFRRVDSEDSASTFLHQA